ncbi:MAG: signal peptidase II [Pseudomonadota bacterium]
MATTKKINIKPIIGFGLIIDFIIIDQLVKWAILDYVFRPMLDMPTLGLIDWFKDGERLPFVSLEVLPFFNLSMVWNKGVSFGMFQNENIWPLTILALVISGIFSVWLAKSKSWVETISLSMIIGGALGNVIDRLHFGAVADFFDFHIADWHYPAFNIADSLITVGIVILVIHSLFFSPEKDAK